MQLSDKRNVVNSLQIPPAMGAGRFSQLGWRELWAVLRHPWAGAQGWPWVRWLTPVEIVARLGPGGERQSWKVGLDGQMARAESKNAARWIALVLPQSIVLYRSITLPAALEQAQIRRAIELEAFTSNPFAEQDLCWNYVADPAAAGQAVRMQLIMASRGQVARYLQEQAALLPPDTQPPEIWAPLAADGGYVVMPGYGEAARQAHQRRGRALHLLALGLLALMLACIAVTPTLQLRARAIEAVHAYDTLHQQASQVVASREALVGATGRIAQIETLERDNAPPARIIDALSASLGDDTYLTALRIEGARVVLDGQTTNAAQLMQELGRQPGILEVTAPVPATRPFGSGKDNFKIEFRFDPAVFAQPAGKTSAQGGAQ